MDLINYDEFAKVEFKVGEIKEAIKVEGSEKLIKMKVDFGEEKLRIVFSGIQKYYEPEYLVNKKTVFVTNVEKKKIMGEESEAMIFAASADATTAEAASLSLLLLDKELANGSKVF
jgi:methionyl-tRNA synthetase